MNNPIYNLLLFLLFMALAYLIFNPIKGWFWILKSRIKLNEKTIIEDILKGLYHFENSGETVRFSLLYKKFPFNNRVVRKAVKKMIDKELITKKNDVLKLKNSGRDYAIKIIRVHRLWEQYLAEKTGFNKIEWHERAEKMEHKLNTEQTNLLASELGNPIYDPHGDPIPNRLGQVPNINGVAVNTLKVNSVGKIVHIEDEPENIYKQILTKNIHIGSVIKVIENTSDYIVFFSEGEEFKLTPEEASNITIQISKKQNPAEMHKVRLTSLKETELSVILGISKECRGAARRRLLDLGFVKGTPIKIDLLSPLNNPKSYWVKGTSIALRNDQASKILIKKPIKHHEQSIE